MPSLICDPCDDTNLEPTTAEPVPLPPVAAGNACTRAWAELSACLPHTSTPCLTRLQASLQASAHGDPEAAFEHASASWAIAQASGTPTSQIAAGVVLGSAYCALDRFAQGIPHLEASVTRSHDQEHPWLRAWALSALGAARAAQGQPARAAAHLEASYALCQTLSSPWLTLRTLTWLGITRSKQGYYALAQAHLQACRDHSILDDTAEPACIRAALVRLAYLQADYTTAANDTTAWLALEQARDNRPGIAQAQAWAGRIAGAQGEATQAAALFEASWTQFQQQNDPQGMARVLRWYGTLAANQIQPLLANACYAHSLTLSQATPQQASHALRGLAEVAYYRDDYAAAETATRQRLTNAQARGDGQTIAHATLWSGWIAAAQGATTPARTALEAALRHYRTLDDQAGIAQALRWLATVTLGPHPDPTAHQAALAEALQRCHTLNNPAHTIATIELGAKAALARGETTRAARLLGAATAARTRRHIPLALAERRDYEHCRARLTRTPDATAAWATGETLTLEQALAACA